MKCIEFTNEKQRVKDFLRLPKQLYKKEENTEDPSSVRDIITGKHQLCKYFKLYKFLVYKQDKVVARFAITIYPKDKTAYFGFFECINDDKVARYVFKEAESFAKEQECNKLVGPVDASFWIKYRLKTNQFDKRPYTGEPYNKDYYQDLFKDNGFTICDHYTSNHYVGAEYEYINKEYEGKYKEFTDKGYEIRSIDIKEFDKSIEDMYRLITTLYSDFPIYKNLSKEDFIKTFSSFKSIINPSMVKFGYKDGKMVGFFISIPNYHNTVYHLTPVNLVKILKTRKDPEEYVMLYMGVDQKHHGLGRALVYSIIQELNQSKKPSIGALAHDSKVTQDYAKEMVNNVYEYVLLEKEIK